MAWNQPGNNDPWGRRRGQDGQNVDEAFKNFQKKLENLLKGGGSGGASGGGAAETTGGDTKGVFWAVGALLLAGWAYQSFFTVGQAERGVVTTFGAFSGVRESGLQFALWPIQRVQIVNVGEVRSSEYKSRVLTQDLNLVDMALSVQYQLRDPVKFLFQIRDPEQTLREVSESAIREVVGRSTLETIFVANRLQVTERTRELIQRTLDQYNAGIFVSTVNLTDIQVPEQVVPSQRDANKALADRERLVKEAEAYASGILPVAEGTASRQVQEAEAYKAQVVATAQGEASRFTAVAEAYNRAPRVTRERLYLEAVEGVLGRSQKVIIDSKGANNMILPLDRMFQPGGRPAEAVVTAPRPAPGVMGSAAQDAQDSAPSASSANDARTRVDR